MVDSTSRKRSFNNTFLWIFLTFLAVVLFFCANHNLDLLHNYAVIYNDINVIQCDDAYNFRDVTDCTIARDCPEMKDIYLNSNLILLLSFFILLAVVASMGIVLWKKSQ